jgi:hypothetical protein
MVDEPKSMETRLIKINNRINKTVITILRMQVMTMKYMIQTWRGLTTDYDTLESPELEKLNNKFKIHITRLNKLLKKGKRITKTNYGQVEKELNTALDCVLEVGKIYNTTYNQFKAQQERGNPPNWKPKK